MKYIKVILFTLVSLIAIPAFADATSQQQAQIIDDKLNGELARMSDDKKAELLNQIQNPDVASTAARWASVGEGIGKGIAATARELGVAVNEFANSRVGMLAILLLMWNYMGQDILNITFVLGFIAIALPMWVRSMRHWFGVYSEKGKFVQYSWGKYIHNEELGAILIAMHAVTMIIIVWISAAKWP